MNLDLGKLKKVKEDVHTATFIHPDGHQVLVKKGSLSDAHKKGIQKLPTHFDEGGQAQSSEQSQPSPEAAPVPQPTVVINNGSQPSQAPSYFGGQGPGGSFDFNQYALQNPNAPIDAKLGAANQIVHQEELQKAGEIASQKRQALEAQKAQQYNQLAQSRGLPMVNVPQQVASIAPEIPNVNILSPDQPKSPVIPQAPSDPYGTQTYYDLMSKGLGQQQAGAAAEAKAIGEQGKAESGVLQQGIEQKQQALQNFQGHYEALNKEREAFINDVKSKDIDPNRYIHNMGFGQKILTAIGLIGGGISTDHNLALNFLNKQIDNDIAAQKENQGSRQSLLKANMAQFGNMRDATDMTRLMTQDIVTNQLQQAAANAKDPIAKANYLKIAGGLQERAAPVMSQIAMRRTLLGGMQSGASNPGQVIRMIVPENMQKDAYKELGEAQQLQRAKDNILSSFDKVANINTVGGRLTSPIQTPKQVHAILDPIIAQLSKETAGRFTETDSKFLGSLFPSPGDSAETQQTKRSQVLKLVNEKMNFPLLQSYGIQMGNSGQGGKYSEQGEKKIQLGAPVIK